MAIRRAQGTSVQAMRSKKRVITSCSECYRRKQKCDRARPCNFCCTRGVPQRCRYEGESRHHSAISLSTQDEKCSPAKGDAVSNAEMSSASSASFIDQLGYSAVSRQDQLRPLGEYLTATASSEGLGDRLIGISDTSAYDNLVARIPPEKTTNELLRLHFLAEQWSFPILDEHHFRELHSRFGRHLNEIQQHTRIRYLPAALLTFPALLFSVLATAVQFIDPQTDIANKLGVSTIHECDELSRSYIATGQEIIELFKHQKPTTLSIEYHLTKMSWLKNCGRGNEAWQCLGVALRQAQEIDLHQIQDYATHSAGVGVEERLLQLWEIEHRKRLWARIFIMDSHMSVGLGRPRGIHREDCSTSTPLDCDYPSNPSQTVPASTNHACNPPNSFSLIMFSIELSHKYHDLMSLRALKRDLRDHSTVEGLHNEVLSMLSSLPPALRPSFPDTTWDLQNPMLPNFRLRLLITANIFLLALHRPYITTHVTSRHAALRAAFAMLQAQQELFADLPQAQHKLYGYSFYAIDAAMFITATVVKYPNSDPDISTRALQLLQRTSSYLTCMKQRSKVAETGEIVLQKCCALIEATTPSPSSIASYDIIEGQNPFTGVDNMEFLQDYSARVPDQATHELISFLTDPSTSINSSSSAAVSVDDRIYEGMNSSLFNPIQFDGMGYSDLATFDHVQWPS